VEKEGSCFERIFLGALERREAGPVLDALTERQDARGAIGGLASDDEAGDVHTTVRALTALDTFGVLDHPVVERAVGYLVGEQAPDGSWPPPGADGEEARIESTGRVGGILSRTPFARMSVLDAGEGFLRERWNIERVQGPSYGPILAYFQVLANARSEIADEALQWCGRELERGFRTHAFDALATARVFLRVGARALPGATIELEELLIGLVTEQAGDGSWSSGDGAGRVADTLTAAEALVRLG